MKTPASRPCAWTKCRTVFAPQRDYARYCSHACGSAASYTPKAKRAERRATKALRHPNAKFIHAALADNPPGECIYCPEKVPGPGAYICGGKECRTEYNRDWRRGRRENMLLSNPPAPVVKPCACGCGETFVRQHNGQSYVSEAHSRKAQNRRRRKRTAEVRKKTGRSKWTG